MAPRDFSEDGAVGAGSGGGSAPATGSQTGGFSVNDAGLPMMGGGTSPNDMMQAELNASARGSQIDMGPAYMPTGDNAPQSSRGGGHTVNSGPRIGTPEWNAQFIQLPGGYQRVAGFSEGGAIDDAEDINGSPEQDQISKSLESVDQVLAFGRKLHGLGGGDNEGAIDTAGAMPMIPGNQSETPGPYKPGTPRPQKTAAAMPMIPGNQSENGRPPQPMPGPLPPTSNPFGKRADNDSDDAPGAIDTDEDAA